MIKEPVKGKQKQPKRIQGEQEKANGGTNSFCQQENRMVKIWSVRNLVGKIIN